MIGKISQTFQNNIGVMDSVVVLRDASVIAEVFLFYVANLQNMHTVVLTRYRLTLKKIILMRDPL